MEPPAKSSADLHAFVLDDPSSTEFHEPGTSILTTNSTAEDISEAVLSCGRNFVLFNNDSTSQTDVVAKLKSAGSIAGKTIGVRFGHEDAIEPLHDQNKHEKVKALDSLDDISEASTSSRAGLILAVVQSQRDRERVTSLEKNIRIQRHNFEEQDSAAHLGDVDSELVTVTDEASKCILQGQNVLFVVEGRALHSMKNFVRLLVPPPKYILSTSPDILGPLLEALRIKRAGLLGSISPGYVVWRSDESLSKFTGVPIVICPREPDETILWNLITPKNPPKMQYQRLGKSAIKISRIILGCMTFGNPAWEGSPWVLPEEKALPLLKKAFDCGINTWDTANTYSNGQSEMIIGKALETYSIPRSKVVIMTKLYYPVLDAEDARRPSPAVNTGELVNQMGLSRKHIFEAVDASLRRLKTTYIDVLQLHRLDPEAEPEEVMRALHDLVQMGKVHYLGASSMYCWQLARLQYTAKMNGWTPFSSMQNLYNLLYREEEREVNPFCRAEGIGLVPWSPLARGLLARPWNQETERSKRDAKTEKWFKGDANDQIVRRVETLAQRKGCTMTAVAIAWLLHKGACPIVGLNTAERIESISEALDVKLEEGELKFLEECYCPLAVQAI
ncbi:NADP-dependent oxidoreductase domain-containing protein [Aspergillus floccosus]